MKKIAKKLITDVLFWESKLVLKKYKPKIIAVTGSVGKTSTKDAIYTVIASTTFARKSQKSFNSEIGVPLTILGLKNAWSNPFLWLINIVEGLLVFILPFKYPKVLVLEVGADRPGDIKKITELIKPDIAVITRFGDVPVHVEFFPSIEDLVNEKGHLPKALKETGTFIYNKDDKRIVTFAESAFHPNSSIKQVTYGFDSTASIYASGETITYAPYEHSDLEFPHGMMMQVHHSGSTTPLNLPDTIGMHHMYPLLAAFSVGISEGMNPEAISKALENHVAPKGRMKLIPGIKDTLIIDDTYNSSPVAVHAALLTLQQLKASGRKIAILGDMMELGQYSIEEHKKVGEFAQKSIDMLITVGVRSRVTAEAAQNAGISESNILQFESSREVGKYLESVVKPGDIILVKGSQSMRMEKIVEEIMMHPEDKEKLLVRQDKEWQKK